MDKKIWGNPSGAFVICVDAYEDGVMRGRIYPSCSDEKIDFHGVMDFLKCIESQLNQMQFPQSFCSGRTFATRQPTNSRASDSKLYGNGQLATYALKILFRQNASWQGSLSWLERNQEATFRSVLEMLMLIDSALSKRDH